MMSTSTALEARIEEKSGFVDRLLSEVGKVIVGQRALTERVLIGILCDGHVLIEGVPGLAKTLTVKTFAQAMKGSFARLQFTPDLLPADLVGTQIFDPKTGSFSPKLGPIFANLVLADEINRAPAKVQSALLEAMQERQVTIGETTHKLPDPFLVFATQNPLEQQGTYPLPEAQVDRFMLKLKVDYPSKEEEFEIMRRIGGASVPTVEPVTEPSEITDAKMLIQQMRVDEKIYRYILDLVFATRQPADFGLNDMTQLIEVGASPRASLYLLSAARAHAFLCHRGYVKPEDVKAVAFDVMRHRVIPTYEAEAEGIAPERILEKVLDTVKVP
jgi:MoxR-like ATPase